MGRDALRVIGTNVTLLEQIRRSAVEDLGIAIEFEILSGVECQQKGVLHPEEFDILDQWFHNIDLMWTARSIQPIETGRIELWDEVGDLTITGQLTPQARKGQGNNPCEVQFVQADGTLGPRPTAQISMLPTAHNADAFIYTPEVGRHYRPGEPESWAWFFDEKWSGRCALHADPAISVADVTLAAQAANLVHFNDPGNLDPGEIDDLVSLMIERKRSRHFRLFWSTFDESVALMEQKNTALSTCWSPAIARLQASDKEIVSAAPREGYRGWHSGLALSSRLSGHRLDDACRYLNWWLSGKAGAAIARQGYYMSVPSTTQRCLSAAEWGYWYLGEAAREDIPGTDGRLVARAGDVRHGGSHDERMSNIAVWSTLMDEHNYLVRRWNEFLAV